jgi:hyaluronoglucosaminidase
VCFFFQYQLADLEAHLVKLSQDVQRVIPSLNFSGLAVIDWEEWRPIFERNGYNEHQKIYLRASESLVRNKHPDWSEKQVQDEARVEFENSSKYAIKNNDVCSHLFDSICKNN